MQATHTSQQGVALLTILLLVVAITIVAGSMLANQQVMLRQYELTQNQGNFRNHALAGEMIAQQLIAQDAQANQTDSLQDSWAKPIPDYTVAGGKVHIQLADEASRFNLNNLYHDGKVDTRAVSYFQALLTQYGIEPNVAMAVLDWQDPDSEPSPEGGAEASYYQSTGKPSAMPIANQPFSTVDELQYVRGMDADKLRQLRPLLTAVPYYLPMNVNTAKPELLAMLPIAASLSAQRNASTQAANPNASQPTATPAIAPIPLNAQAVNSWAMARKTAIPLDSVEKLWSVPVFATLSNEQRQAVTPLLDVQSRAFRTLIGVDVDGKQSYLTSQIAKLPNSPLAPVANSQPTPVQVISYHRQFLPMALPIN